jgi:hypothetical protein
LSGPVGCRLSNSASVWELSLARGEIEMTALAALEIWPLASSFWALAWAVDRGLGVDLDLCPTLGRLAGWGGGEGG